MLNTFVVVVAVQADTVVAVIISVVGLLTAEAVPLKVVEASYSLRDKDTKITTAITESYFALICVDSATGNMNTQYT